MTQCVRFTYYIYIIKLERKVLQITEFFFYQAVLVSTRGIFKIFIWQAIVKGRSVSTEGPFFLDDMRVEDIY